MPDYDQYGQGPQVRFQWEHLYQQLHNNPQLRTDLPAQPPKITPLVNSPICGEHCRRHTIDRPLTCPGCGAHVYDVVAHEWPWSEGHCWTSIEPANGSPAYVRGMACPACNKETL